MLKVVGSDVIGKAVAGEADGFKFWDDPFADDFDDFIFVRLVGLLFAIQIFFGFFGLPCLLGFDLFVFSVAVVDVLEVENNFVAAAIPGEDDSVTVDNLTSDTGFSNFNGVCGRNVGHKLRTPIDLEFVET